MPAGLPAEIVARRPDLVAAERRLAAADQPLAHEAKIRKFVQPYLDAEILNAFSITRLR